MMKRILVPIDGSPRAEKALPIVAAIARANEATLLLLRVVDVSREAVIYGTVPSPVLESVGHNLRVAAENYIAECARSEMFVGVTIETMVVMGDAPDSILTHSEAWRADLIVLCSHGRTGLARWALGSVAEHVSRHSRAPVLMLRDAGPLPRAQDANFERVLRVLVPLDGSHQAEASLGPAAELMKALAAPQKGALHLTVILSPFETDPANVPDAFALEGARSYLARVTNQLREAHCGISVTWSVVVELDIAEALIRIARNGEDVAGAENIGGCDLIAMTTHGSGGIARWVMGSVTDRVLHATTMPILIVRPPESTSR